MTMKMGYIDVYFSLGSNMGDRRRNLEGAVKLLNESLGSECQKLSQVIETSAVGFSGGKFLNAAALYRIPITSEDPVASALELLGKVKEIERNLGRDTQPARFDESGKRIYTSRPIDIDILFYGTERIDTPELTIPHKDMQSRPFVMIPLREIAKEKIKNAFPEIF